MASTKVHLVGDVMIGRSFNEILNHNPKLTHRDSPVNLIDSDDILIGNLETTLTSAPDKWKWPDKEFNYKLSPSSASVLNQIDFTQTIIKLIYYDFYVSQV
jgi:poly-gamma-glutamate capsule biosynthesis protein CapA/YwtB (metallophosphatase superfamily)